MPKQHAHQKKSKLRRVKMMLLLIGLALCGLVPATSGDYSDPHCANGTSGIVHLFEWKWSEIEKECPRLFASGFCGVQTPIPTEHLVRNSPSWLDRYLPVSYDLASRSGDEEEFISMVQACKAAGIRVFVTLQLDYMSPDGGVGYNGTAYDATSLDYPGVPFDASHFHTKDKCSDPHLKSSSPASDMQNCWVLGHPNLDHANPYVRDTMVKLLNRFVSMGVAGFFLTDAMHIVPEDLEAILEQVRDVEIGGRPFMTYEMINTVPSSIDSSWFYPIGRVTDYTVSEMLGKALVEDQDLSGLCLLLNSSSSLLPRQFSSVLPADQAVVFVHDVSYQRGRSPPWAKVVTYKNPDLYKLASSLLLASGYGVPRILSGYEFTNTNQGPPTDVSGDVLGVTSASDGDCGNGWVCEHRFEPIKDTLKFRNSVRDQDIKDCTSNKNTISFSRGDAGHYWAALGTLEELRDDLPKERKWVEENKEYVEELRTDGLTIMEFGGVATVAFYTGSLTTIVPTTAMPTTPVPTTPVPTTPVPTTPVPTTPVPTTPVPTTPVPTTPVPTTTEPTIPTTTTKPPPPPPPPKPTSDFRRTLIFIKKVTKPGEALFLLGGNGDPAAASKEIPIKHRKLIVRNLIPQRNEWIKGDKFLDWIGREDGQDGQFKGEYARGTPAQWTTNKSLDKYYSNLNKFGEHYWMVDVDMDCLKTDNGFFEFRGKTKFLERARNLGTKCKGGEKIPRSSDYHLGMCGKINVFEWGESECTIMKF